MNLFLIIAFLIIPVFKTYGQHYDYIDIIDMLIDLENLAVLPEAGEKCAQWSSYDRSSQYIEGTDEYLNWAANDDGDGFICYENGDKVLAEMEGPGCIWRIWCGDPGSGHVKIYLDNSTEPTIDLECEDYFNLTVTPFNNNCLVYDAAQGKNNYTPIPYNSACKIIGDDDWGRYYHFTYSTFPDGTTVQTFDMDLSDEEEAALNNVNNFLKDEIGTDPAGSRFGEQTSSNNDVDINGNSWYTLADIEGERAITSIKIKINNISDDLCYDVLRELALYIYWDNESTPSVWSPLGDFFGTAPGINKYESLPLGMYKDGNGFYSFWYMPFESRAYIRIKNDGNIIRNISYSVTHAPLTKPISALGRFHSKWNRNPSNLPTRSDRWPDWTVLTTSNGKGRFLGFILHNYRPTSSNDPNSEEGYWWWGEGDAKFFIDGETFPSIFGTGTEDYFGYAWCDPSLFNKAYHNQTLNEGNNGKGNISVNRFQITDNIPFQSSFEGAIEKYYSDTYARYAVTPYWYLESGGNDPYETVPLSGRINYYETQSAISIPGKIEAEDYIKMHGIQTESTTDVGGGMNVGWIDTDDWMDYYVDVPTTGNYYVSYRIASLSESGQIQLMCSDSSLIKTDLPITNGWQNWETVTTTVNLTKGTRILRVYVSRGGFNLNWLDLNYVTSSIQIPKNFTLFHNYPNPFQGNTTIEYTIPENADVEISLYDVLGKKVKILFQGYQQAGDHILEINNNISAGTYYYKLKAGNYSAFKKCIAVH